MLAPVPTHDAPEEILRQATERAEARAEQDWRRADDLKASIEAAGWTVTDSGTDFELRSARPADVVESGHTLYGAPESVPSRLDEPDLDSATVVIISAGRVPAVSIDLADLLRSTPAPTSIVVVAERGFAADDLPDHVEVIWTAVPFSPGAALQVALRRASGEVLVVLEPELIVRGDFISPLQAALGDDTVAIVGLDGLRSADMRRYQPDGPGDVTALAAGCYAFRRRDALAAMLPDDRLQLSGSLAAWWSLELRDSGPDVPPRRAVAIDLPLTRHEPDETARLRADHTKLARRDAYRIAARFARRADLAAGATGAAGAAEPA